MVSGEYYKDMSEVIEKKISQMKLLMARTEKLLAGSFSEFREDTTRIAAAERNFQLLVDLASDVNAQILVEKYGQTPDTYKQTFTQLDQEKIISHELTEKLIRGVQIRNILVHEYDFEEDYEKFYYAAKEFLPAYQEYMQVIYRYIQVV